jgi:serine/threonine protein kinase/Flp pilus assembly protein TadD
MSNAAHAKGDAKRAETGDRSAVDAERYQQVKAAFLAAETRPPEQRRAAVEELCAGNDWLRDEVESLLGHSDTPAVDLDAAASDISELFTQLEFDEQRDAPAQIGRYRIISRLGEGGMGVVYLAEQDQPRRQVALKVLRTGAAFHSQSSMWRRFVHEAEILARLHHPGIAQIYDAGVADTGAGPQPYYAMEYVPGEPLTRYATTRDLSTRQRLELMVLVCRAVQHAHLQGVIHRDLKPSNILVDEGSRDQENKDHGEAERNRGHSSAVSHDSPFPRSLDAVPKILDFGIARTTSDADADLQLTTMATSQGQLLGTLPYMSPEQIAGRPAVADARSDVFALGVICFELIAGRLPHDLSSCSMLEAARIMRDEEPTSLTSISRVFRGDVATIVSTAMEKQPERRYQSAAALADDISRYLAGEPIAVRRDSVLYVMRKRLRRYRWAAAVALLFVTALTAFAVYATALATEQRALAESELEARKAADHEARVAQAINTFLTDKLLAQADPKNEGNRDITLREVLDRAAVEIEGEFEGQPVVEADIRTTLGETYRNLGLLEEAETHFFRALELYHKALGPEHKDTLVAMVQIAHLYSGQGKFDEAERQYLEVLDLQRRVLGEMHPHTLTSMNNLAGILWRQGRFAEVEPLWLLVLEARRRSPDVEAWRVATTLNNLGCLYNNLGRYDDSERMHGEALEIRRRDRGEEHPDTLQSIHNLAALYVATGRRDEAIELNRRNLSVRQRVLGDDHPDALFTTTNLGRDLSDSGQLEEAETLLTTAMERRTRVLGERHLDTLQTMFYRAQLHVRQGELAQTDELLRHVLAVCREDMQPSHFLTGKALTAHGVCLAKLGQPDEAERSLLEGRDILELAYGPHHEQTLVAIDALIAFYEDAGREDEASTWRAARRDVEQD